MFIFKSLSSDFGPEPAQITKRFVNITRSIATCKTSIGRACKDLHVIPRSFFLNHLAHTQEGNKILAHGKHGLHRDAFELPEETFRWQYRLTKNVVRWLCDELREEPELRRLRRSWTVMTVEQQMLCALCFYATGSFQGMVASDEHIARDQTTVSIVVRAVSLATVQCLGIRRGWIDFSQTTGDRDDVERGFQRLGRIPGVIGCVDGTMIAIVGPPKNDPSVTEAAYWCRKQYYALNVMVVCDADCRVTSIDPRYPGSVHDSFAWRYSWLRSNFEQGRLIDDGRFLLMTTAQASLAAFFRTSGVKAASPTSGTPSGVGPVAFLSTVFFWSSVCTAALKGFRSRPGSLSMSFFRLCNDSIPCVVSPLAGSPLQRPCVLGILLQTPHFLGVPRVGVSPPYGQLLFLGLPSTRPRQQLSLSSAVHPPPLSNSTKSTSPPSRNPRPANGSVPSARVSGPAPASHYGTEENLDIGHLTRAALRRWYIACDLSLGGAGREASRNAVVGASRIEPGPEFSLPVSLQPHLQAVIGCEKQRDVLHHSGSTRSLVV
ncbi:hypothetical protein HPB47_027308 [Ixodes persulcatus]|uniref:Uncharacterized protein n=1 Tax=Ixodes persulcatus TaxID=34615 RepID=A0AC60PWE2_IXOPE|nr:hypothetical protein HPB47_027308 [Ixodes persulcatus]